MQAMQLELSEGERAVLVDLLRSRLGDLRSEIYSTDSPSFKEGLKERERIIVTLLERLEPGVTAPPAA